jgi:Ser/Thr protein kinase RdoA (MazF antagonist)
VIGAVPAAHTVFATEQLASRVADTWELSGPVSGRLLAHGVNDTYLITSRTNRYALRVYRHGARTEPEIRYELDLLAWADRAGLPVSPAIPTPLGDLMEVVAAPEGDRQLVLFRYLPGSSVSFPPPPGTYALLGELTATLHEALASYAGVPTPRRLDGESLLAGPLRLIEADRHARGEAVVAVATAARSVQALVEQRSAQWERGICHGDIGLGNLLVDEHGGVSLLDFDSCGTGWLAYDLAVFRWWASAHQAGDAPWKQFLAGYRSVRQLRPADEEATALLVLVRQIWVLGLQIGLAPALGANDLATEAWPQALRIIDTWLPSCGLPHQIPVEVGGIG